MGKEKPITINETLDRLILDSSERVFYFAKKRLRSRRYAVWLVIVAASVGFALYSLFVRANIFSYYPSSCLGTWDNPQNAQGEPSLGPGARPEEFNKDNSAFYDGGGAKQVFCGGFRSEGDETEKIFKKAILKFTWAIASPTPTPMVEQSDFENNILDLAPDEGIIVVPDGSLPDTASESGETVIPDLSPLASSAIPLEMTSPTPEATPEPLSSPSPAPSPVEEPTPIPTPEPLPTFPPENLGGQATPEPVPPVSEPAPEPPVSLLRRFMLASIFSDIASDSVLSSIEPSPSPEIPASPSPSFIPLLTSSPSFIPSTTPSTSLPPSVAPSSPSPSNVIATPSSEMSASVSYSLDDFLEVFYTTDGQNWQSLGRVNKDNFENLEFEVPIASWEELEKLQVSVAGVFTTDAGQKVYLDGMRVEAEYEIEDTFFESDEADINQTDSESTGVVPSGVLKERKIQKAIVIDQKADHSCRVDPFSTDISNHVPASAKIFLKSNSQNQSEEVEIGNLPLGIDIVFSKNKDYIYRPQADERTLDLEITSQDGAQKGSFSIPIFYTIIDSQNSTAACQINLINFSDN